MIAVNAAILENILEAYKFTAFKDYEEDGAVILVLKEISFLIETGKNEEEAVQNMAKAILEFAEDFYKEFDLWSSGEGKKHIPYIIKALFINNVEKIGELIECRPGEI